MNVTLRVLVFFFFVCTGAMKKQYPLESWEWGTVLGECPVGENVLISNSHFQSRGCLVTLGRVDTS